MSSNVKVERWFFADPKSQALIKSEGESWVGTPFRPYSRAKGRTGGIDCIGLAEELHRVCKSAPAFHFPRSDADYQGHAFGDRVLKWLRGEYTVGDPPRIGPQSKKLARIFAELKLPDVPEGEHYPAEFFLPGDLLVMQRKELFHMPIVYEIDTPGNHVRFVNAIPRLGVVRGTLQDWSYRQHLVAAFRAMKR